MKEKLEQIFNVAEYCNSKVTFIKSDGLNAEVKVLAQHLTTAPFKIDHSLSFDEMVEVINHQILINK